MSIKSVYVAGTRSKRLPRYFRCLRECLMNGEMKISSAALAQMLDITPSQVRADLNEFAGAGVQGYGYSVKHLYTDISRELGVADGLTAVIVGRESPEHDYLIEKLEGRGITVIDMISLDERTYDRLAGIKADIAVITECNHLPMLIKAFSASEIRGVWNMTQKDFELDVPVLNLPIGDIIMALMCEVRYNERNGEGK